MSSENLNIDPVFHTQNLIQCKSITPLEGGALDYLQNTLAPLGFVCERLPFSETGTADVDNLYARLGTQPPHLCFAGHTDVVPPGDEASWTHPPFAANIHDTKLYGRGAVDMKGGIACFLAATIDVLLSDQQGIPGSVSFLITGDEEGPAINGTQKVLEWLKKNKETIDHCLVGEPTNPKVLGEMIKIGRRGSLNVMLTLKGKQGHVAYPEYALNPVHVLLSVLDNLIREPLDLGTEHFAPSHLEITSVDVGNPATNIIPEQATAKFNIRYNTTYTASSLKSKLRALVADCIADRGLSYEFRFQASGDCFLTEPGLLSDCLTGAIYNITGQTPSLSTSGGTSDARFIKNYCPVIEFGLVNETIHQVDEHTDISDLLSLKRIYKDFILNYFNTFKA